MVRPFSAVVLLAALVAACAQDDQPAAMPEPEPSTAQIEQLQADAQAYADEHIRAWPDVEEYLAAFAEDAVFADPSFDDVRSGKEGITSMLDAWAGMTDYRIEVDGLFVATDGVVYQERWPGLLPPVPNPAAIPETTGLEVYGFDADRVVRDDLWYLREDNEHFEFGCFAVDDCPALVATVQAYVDAWSSRRSDSVEALYHDDARFRDTMLGLEADGAGEIAGLAEVRFGSGGDLLFDVLDLYTWTDGYLAPTAGNPDQGQLTGVAIHYRVGLVQDHTLTTQEGLTTLVLGRRDETGIEADPDGLIHDEDVFHRPATLLARPVDTGTIRISIEELSGLEGYRLLGVVSSASEDELSGGVFWTVVDSDPFSAADVVHPPAHADLERVADATDWGATDYWWDREARLEPGRYQIQLWANPGNLAPYGSHIPAEPIERRCRIDADVAAGEETVVAISQIPIDGSCPEVDASGP